MTIDEARARVAKGAALLDAQRPGWAQRIDIGTLDISKGCKCVLGQVFGGYSTGYVALFGPDMMAGVEGVHEYGFCGHAPSGDYRLLQDAWIEVICDRLLASPVETPIAQDEEKHDEVHVYKS